MGIEFLGNKEQLLQFIYSHVSEETDDAPKIILDLFCGTGSVSKAFKVHGYQVVANDFLFFCAIIAKSILYNNEPPSFLGLQANHPYIFKDKAMSPYRNVLEYLNGIDGEEGFVYRHYSPASLEIGPYKRMYFTETNAKKIDAIRSAIASWSDCLDEKEEAVLISDLLAAVSKVSNVAATYGCYMKYWKTKALQPVLLLPQAPVFGVDNTHQVLNSDANELVNEITSPIIYADPPYTKRQYSAYYHILETIALNDKPEITGKTGLRYWQTKSSPYCYKRTAGAALRNLVAASRCQYFFLSYNSDGQISHEDIQAILSGFGQVTCWEVPYKRYKSNRTSSARQPLIERLYMVKKNAI